MAFDCSPLFLQRWNIQRRLVLAWLSSGDVDSTGVGVVDVEVEVEVGTTCVAAGGKEGLEVEERHRRHFLTLGRELSKGERKEAEKGEEEEQAAGSWDGLADLVLFDAH